MLRKRVFVTRPIAPEGIVLLEKAGLEVEVFQGQPPAPKEVMLARARQCDALLTDVDDIVDGDVLAAGAGRLTVVANAAVGHDNIDLETATRLGILAGNTPGVLHHSVAEYTFGLLIAAARNMTRAERHVRAGEWKAYEPMPFIGYDLYGRTLGVVGLGQIGLEVAKRALGFDMKVLYYDPIRRPEAEKQYKVQLVSTLHALLPQCDFISIHTPLTQATHHLIGRNKLAMMKRSAVLVNTARGGIVDTQALYEALVNGVIAAAALDVTEPEPLPPDHPLLSLPNVIVTPHIASASNDAIIGMATMAARNIIAALNGEPMPSCLNPQALTQKGAAPANPRSVP